MRICFVGKYPPIQGGVSAQTYWAARGLAGRGHEVFVVTNAAEVEDAYRVRLDGCDPADYAPSFPEAGAVRVFGTVPAGRRMGHIPMANPFVSRLAGLATQVVREYRAEVVVASYLEPYAVAGFLASRWTGVPLVVRHAGSDLERLMRLPELAETYREVLRAADAVVTPRGLSDRFRALGVRPGAIRPAPPFAVPVSVFNPAADPLAPARIDDLAALLPDADRRGRSFDPNRPTIGVYGKAGETKGTYDLLAACALLRADGLDFNLLLLTGSGQAHAIGAALDDGGLREHTWVLPFLPHWQVPQFIRACTAVCFLERDFPIAIHAPTVPREVLACGTCLVLSGEIHRKQAYRDRFVHGVNVVLVPDPRDRAALAERLRPLVHKPDLAAEIGRRGRLVTEDLDDFDSFVDAWEALLDLGPAASGREAPEPAADRIERVVAWVRPVLGDSTDRWIERFLRESVGFGDGLDADLADRFCRFLLANPPDGVDPVLLADLVGYQRARLWAGRDPRPEEAARTRPAPLMPVPRPGRVEPCPEPAVPLRVERFHHDVVPVFCGTHGSAADAVRDVARGPTVVCFARRPNLAPSETRLNEATAALLDLCDGRRSVAQIASVLAHRTDADRRAGADATVETTAVATAVRRLCAAGLLSLREGGET